jgi:hypothetical protein
MGLYCDIQYKKVYINSLARLNLSLDRPSYHLETYQTFDIIFYILYQYFRKTETLFQMGT